MKACAIAAGTPASELEDMDSAANSGFLKEMFDEFDTNKDGNISWDECWTFLKDKQP